MVLKLTWEAAYRRVVLEIDSTLVQKTLTKPNISINADYTILVERCKELINRAWLIKIAHIYREANMVVDGVSC